MKWLSLIAVGVLVAACDSGGTEGAETADEGQKTGTTADDSSAPPGVEADPGFQPGAGLNTEPPTEPVCEAAAAVACDATSVEGLTATAQVSSDLFEGRSCANGEGAAGQAGALDVAFRFQATFEGRYRITTEGSSFDTVLFVRSDCDGQDLTCGDDVGSELHSAVVIDLASCEAITIIVEGYGIDDAGTVNLAIEQLSGDGAGASELTFDCGGAEVVTPECLADVWPEGWVAQELEMLDAMNKARAAGAFCEEDEWHPAAPPLEMDDVIRVAARLHSMDMTENYYFEHLGLDGRTFDIRMEDVGFDGAFPWAENIARGYSTGTAAVDGLMTSPGHCRNIMDPEHRVVGLGYYTAPDNPHNWTQNFAASH